MNMCVRNACCTTGLEERGHVCSPVRVTDKCLLLLLNFKVIAGQSIASMREQIHTQTHTILEKVKGLYLKASDQMTINKHADAQTLKKKDTIFINYVMFKGIRKQEKEREREEEERQRRV